MGGGVEVEAKEGGGGQTMVKTGVGGPRRPGIAVLARPLVLRGGRRGARGRARRAGAQCGGHTSHGFGMGSGQEVTGTEI